MDPIVRRIAAELGAPDVVEALARLPGSDLQSLLLAVARARAEAVTPAALLAQAERSGAVAPSSIDSRVYADFDRAAYAAAAGFDALDLAPVAPFATDAVLGAISPNNVLTTTRPYQVLADPTSAMALEAARRRRRGDRSAPTRLIASHRVLRLQPFEGEGFTPHFRLLALVTAGRDQGSSELEVRSLREQIGVYLRLFAALTPAGFSFAPVEVVVSDTDVVRALLRASGVDPAVFAGVVHAVDVDRGAGALAAHGVRLPERIEDPARDLSGIDDPAGRTGRARLARVAAEVFPPLAAEFPAIRFRIDGSRVAGLGYYQGLMLQLWATTPAGASLPLGDGGFTTWTQRLLADRKERLLTSGLGVELACKLYRVGG